MSYWCVYQDREWRIVGKEDREIGLKVFATGNTPEEAWENFHRKYKVCPIIKGL